MINIAVPGVGGRMGAEIAAQVLQSSHLTLTVAMVREGNKLAGTKLPKSNLVIATSLDSAKFDVLIDFTLPEGVMRHVDYCVQNKIAMVIGSTGLSDPQLKTIRLAAEEIPIVLSANMSVGVNVCYKLLANAAQTIDKNWDISILDVHHKNKKDSPSGTAKQMANILSVNSNKPLDEINIYSERQGETVGEHTVTFASEDELIMIAHIAENRSIYAKGALIAAKWVFGRAPGLYSMMDVV